MHKLIPVAGSAFGIGFYLASCIYRNDRPSTLHAATILNPPPQPNSSVTDLVPVKPAQGNIGTLSRDDATINRNRIGEIMRHGYPSLDNLRVFEDFVLSYDRRNRVANWVFEHITAEKLKRIEETDRGKSQFKEDPFIHPYFRSRNEDYLRSGYDRGHLAAAANHRSSQKLMDETFFLSNMAPQVGVGFNRDKWNDLEMEVRNLAKKYDNIWVCTGPLYLPRKESDNKLYVKYEVIGSQNVAVPTHFFKVILAQNNRGEYSIYSYVLPNQPCDSSIPLTSYMVPLDSIERAAGFLLFDKIPRNQIKAINSK